MDSSNPYNRPAIIAFQKKFSAAIKMFALEAIKSDPEAFTPMFLMAFLAGAATGVGVSMGLSKADIELSIEEAVDGGYDEAMRAIRASEESSAT